MPDGPEARADNERPEPRRLPLAAAAPASPLSRELKDLVEAAFRRLSSETIGDSNPASSEDGGESEHWLRSLDEEARAQVEHGIESILHGSLSDAAHRAFDGAVAKRKLLESQRSEQPSRSLPTGASASASSRASGKDRKGSDKHAGAGERRESSRDRESSKWEAVKQPSAPRRSSGGERARRDSPDRSYSSAPRYDYDPYLRTQPQYSITRTSSYEYSDGRRGPLAPVPYSPPYSSSRYGLPPPQNGPPPDYWYYDSRERPRSPLPRDRPTRSPPRDRTRRSPPRSDRPTRSPPRGDWGSREEPDDRRRRGSVGRSRGELSYSRGDRESDDYSRPRPRDSSGRRAPSSEPPRGGGSAPVRPASHSRSEGDMRRSDQASELPGDKSEAARRHASGGSRRPRSLSPSDSYHRRERESDYFYRRSSRSRSSSRSRTRRSSTKDEDGLPRRRSRRDEDRHRYNNRRPSPPPQLEREGSRRGGTERDDREDSGLPVNGDVRDESVTPRSRKSRRHKRHRSRRSRSSSRSRTRSRSVSSGSRGGRHRRRSRRRSHRDRSDASSGSYDDDGESAARRGNSRRHHHHHRSSRKRRHRSPSPGSGYDDAGHSTRKRSSKKKKKERRRGEGEKRDTAKDRSDTDRRPDEATAKLDALSPLETQLR